MEYEKPIQATSFSKKLSNGGIMAPAKAHPYDGVFVTGRSGKLRSSGAVVDDSDYAEIFQAGSTGCSIPVLDIPDTFESTSDGSRSSRPVDYSKIFGGLADSTDFGVPFEDLLPPKPNNARTNPAETRTRSLGRSRKLSFSEEKREPWRRPREQPLVGVKEFNVSYNRTNPGSQNGESRTVPVAEVYSVNGYTRSVVNDAHFDDNVKELPRIPKLSRRAVSGPQPRVPANEASQSYAEARRRSGRSGSMSKDMFHAFEIGVGAQSSGVRSPSSTTSRAHDSSSASRSNMPENKPGNCSPSFSDEEVDANSVAAASAAAVRKAIEQAQAKIKFAKELMEKRKGGRVNFAEMNFGNGFKADKKVARNVEMLNSSMEKEAQKVNGKEQVSSFFARMSIYEQIQVSPDLRDKKELSATEAPGGFYRKKSSATLLDQSAEAYGNERVSTWDSRSDVAMKHDPVTVECLLTNRMKNLTPSTHENGFWKNMKTEGKSEELTECLKETEVNEEDVDQGKVKIQIEMVPGTFQWSFDTNSFKSGQDLEHEEEHESEVRNVHDLGEADQAPNPDHEHGQEQVQLESKQPEVEEGEDIKDMLECHGDDQYMAEMSETFSGVETTDHETEGYSHNLEGSRIGEVVLREGYERRHDQTNLLNGKPREWESTECQENQEDSSSPEADEYRESNGRWKQDNEMKYIETCKDNVVELRSNDLHEEEESNRRAREDFIRGHDKKETVTMGEQIVNADNRKDMSENQLESSSETDREHSQTRLSTGYEEEMEVPQQSSMDADGKNVNADVIYNLREIENFMETEEGGWYEETLEGVSVTAERMESPAYANGTEESDKEWETCEDANGTVEVFIKLEHTMQGLETLETMSNTESAAETNFWSQQKQGEDHLRGLLDVHAQEPHVEEVVWESVESDVDIDESEVGCNEEEYESNTASGNVIESQATCVFPERTDEEVEETMMSSDVEEINVTNEDGDEIAFIHGEEDNTSRSSHEEIQTDNHMHVEAAEQSSSSEGVGRMTEVSLETKFQCSEKREESRHKAEEKDVGSQSEVGIQNKRNVEKDELREKERQRIVVDRAIKEARERAFADARERAERSAANKAVAESQQRETAAATKKPEKAPSKDNGKLAADRAATDTKLKAERAAVERATAEARERALEKALTEKAAAVARNQAAKTAVEKSTRDDGAKSRNNRSYDHQQNGNVASSLRQPDSSHHTVGVSNYGSAYWSKATVERHQRTAERAAKALAEKNMRDLLAQREQAERHRLAETLDADVKRWSSGKERSLRALLSTLQYILGPDSGWQPIPLTDLVLTAAVKKAYRKATLVVHPDKLQQRGASIQQKYICEKVFDLLKEAWNKFSAEER